MKEVKARVEDELESRLSSGAKSAGESKPIFFNLAESAGREDLSRLFETGHVRHVRDEYREQLRELFGIQNPTLVFTPDYTEEFTRYFEELQTRRPLWQRGVWVYFPWISTLSHILPDEDFQSVRMARNRELISYEEQKLYYGGVVGVAGLSVGNSVVMTLVLSGGARHIKIADFDTLDLSNLNRIHAGVDMLGIPKVEVTARQIYLRNPYAQVDIFPHGLTEENARDFFDGLDIMVDELDNLPIKYLVREEARKRRIPVVMAADCGDTGIIDIERYDIDPSIEPFHGRLGDVRYQDLARLDKRSVGKYIAKLVGLENHNERMLQSLQGLGSTLVSWPQLGSTAILNGAALTFCIRRILTRQELIHDRAVISFDALLNPAYDSDRCRAGRETAIQAFAKIFGL